MTKKNKKDFNENSSNSLKKISNSGKDIDLALEEIKVEIQTNKMNKRRLFFRIIALSIVIIVLSILIYIFRDTIWSFIYDSQYRNDKLKVVEQYGLFGKVIIFAIFIIQVILFVIHYGPIAIVTGSLYGPWWTLFLSTLGSSVGVLIVWFISKKMGKKFIKNFVDVDELTKSYSPTKVRRNIFLLASAMLFPGAPKAIFAYVAPFTGVKLRDFLIINAVCKAPMTLLNASIGYGLVSGQWIFTAINGGISLITSLIGFYFARKYNKIVKLENVV